MIKLSVIILSYNTPKLLAKCIERVLGEMGEKGEKGKMGEVIVVENGSDNKIKNQSASWRTKIKYIYNKQNYGFAKGNNIGIKQAKGEYVLLLNSDTEVKDGALRKMVDFMDEHPEVSVLGPKLLNTDGTAQPSTGREYDLLNVFLFLCGDKERVSPEKAQAVEWISGAALMTRRDIFDKIGFLDENIFMYFEDVEWCLRARREGLKIFFYPEAKIIHYGGKSNVRKEAIKQIHKSLIYLYEKHYSKWEQAIIKLMVRLKIMLNRIRK